MNRYICLDLGEKRTGVALVDDETKTPTPLGVINTTGNKDSIIPELVNFLREWEPIGIVVGLPIDLRGNESIAASNMRDKAESLISRINKEQLTSDKAMTLHFVDERLTSVQAKKMMINAGFSAKKRKMFLDSLAAVYIAQLFIDNL